MNDKKWEQFFELLNEITSGLWRKDHSWKESKAEVDKQAEKYGGDTDLEEFVSWFDLAQDDSDSDSANS